MASFEIIWKNSVHQDLKKINPAAVPTIVREVKDLALNPFPIGFKQLRGNRKLYRIRIGDYRAIYEIDKEERSIKIVRIRHRKDVYE